MFRTNNERASDLDPPAPHRSLRAARQWGPSVTTSSNLSNYFSSSISGNWFIQQTHKSEICEVLRKMDEEHVMWLKAPERLLQWPGGEISQLCPDDDDDDDDE